MLLYTVAVPGGSTTAIDTAGNELTNAAMADCLRTVADAYQPSLGD